MTTTTDTYDVWSEAAIEYVRDQLKTNTTTGIGRGEGIQSIEIGIPDLENIASHPEGLPVLWLTIKSDQLGRSAGYVTHRLKVDVHTFSATPRGNQAQYADGQKQHRKIVGRVYNEVLELRDGGKAAGHWLTLDPDGSLQHEGVAMPDRAILHSILPIAFTRDRAWIQGA